MVPANELRIGNRFIRELRTGRGQEFDHDFILTEEWMGKLFSNSLSIALEDLFPIPLTPEIFKIFGVNRIENHEWKSDKTDFISIRERGQWTNGEPFGEIKYVIYKSAAGAISEVASLHQLQNIYYFVTDKELEYKPKS